MPEETKKERRTTARRRWDKEMEAKVTALFEAQRQQGAMLSQQGTMLSEHLVDCSKNSRELRESVSPVVAWVLPQIKKAEVRAKLWQKIYEAVATDTMSFVIKWGVLFAVLAVILGSVPAGRHIVELIKGSLG